MPRFKSACDLICGLMLLFIPSLAGADAAVAETNAPPEIQATETANSPGRDVVVKGRVPQVTACLTAANS